MTKLWSENPVRKAIHFTTTCKRFLADVFEDYDERSGEYYGDEDVESTDEDNDAAGDGEVQESSEDEDELLLSQVDEVF